jgi:hypothetical protein
VICFSTVELSIKIDGTRIQVPCPIDLFPSFVKASP